MMRMNKKKRCIKAIKVCNREDAVKKADCSSSNFVQNVQNFQKKLYCYTYMKHLPFLNRIFQHIRTAYS